jgi:cell division ATPase FtsA
MFKFFSQKKKPEIFLALDIGTEAVKSLIFKKEDDKNTILGKGLEYFEGAESFKNLDFPEEILKNTITRAIDQISKIAKTKNIFLGLPTDVLIAKIVSQNFERKNPKEPISQSEKKKIEEEVFLSIKNKIAQEFSQKTGFLPQDFHFSNLKILETKIDGYNVPSPLNLSGQNLEFRVLVVFLARYQLEKIGKICQNLNLKILKIVHPVENLNCLFPDEKINAIYLDIGGKITNIFLVEKGKLTEISHFDRGGINFTEKLYQDLGLSFFDARTLKENYSHSILSEKVQKRMKEIFSDALRSWFENLKENLKKFPQKLLPANFFLFGGGSLLPDISEILENGDWSNLTFFSQLKIEIVYPKNLKNFEDKNQIFSSPQDIPLILLL